MTYGECFGTGIGESGKIITADTVLEVAAIDESINGDGGLTLGWNSTSGGGLPAGMTVGGYVLLQPYVPTQNGDGSYRYEVKLSDPIALLGKKLFYKTVTVVDKAGMVSETILYTFSFVGKASTIIGALSEACGVSCDTSNLADIGTISVSFDGDSIKSAADKIGSACDVAVWYTSGCIHFGSPVDFISGEYYNHFVVLGGTKNMTKKIVTSDGDEYAAVTQRLTLDATEYPGSVIGSGTPEMTKLLVFDNIYPKARLQVTHVYRRECWLLDEGGDKIPTAWQGDGGSRVATAWAKYTKWYVRLGDVDGEGHIDQDNLESLIVDGTTLRIQFLPFAEGGTSLLAGREFELVHFTQSSREKEDDDVDPNGFLAQAGMYRIVMTADCNTLLPSDALPPVVGDLVTLVNIAVPESCYRKAREELLAAGESVASMYGSSVPSPERYTGVDGGSIGETCGGYLVTNVHRDLITGEVRVTYGTLSQRGMIASLIDRVDSIQTAGGVGTTGSGSSVGGGLGVGTMSSEQWNALAQAGGRTGLATINKRINEMKGRVDDFGTDIIEIQSQADQKMQMWFGTYAPTAENYPAVDWVTDAEKQLHIEDIFYDYSREASDPDGGKAWRWTRHEETVAGVTVVTYRWDEVTDADTLLAIEKASDIASDGKISGGAEKVRLYNEWLRVVGEHEKYNSLHSTYGLDVSRYDSAYSWLGRMLNGGEAFEGGTPLWLASLASTTSILFGSQFVESIALAYPGWGLDTSGLDAASRQIYRCMWAEYYSEADALDRISKATANAAMQSVADMGDDLKITPDEKRELRKQWTAWATEYDNFLLLFAADPVVSALGAVSAYRSAFSSLGGFLYDPLDIDFPVEGSVQSYAALQPTMIWSVGTTTLTSVQASEYRQRMTAFLSARTSMLTALSTQNISFFVSGTPPEPPFFVGDRWLWLNHLADGRIADGETINTGEYEALPATDTMMVCTQALSALPQGQSGYTVSDYWAEASKVFAEVDPDPRNLLAALADRLYVLYGSNAANFPIGVSLDANGSTATPNNGSSDDDGNVASLLSQLQAMIGDADFGVFIQTPLDAQKYDMLCVPVTCSIPGSNGESVTGGIQIKMWDGTEWEYIQESTSSLLESLGNKILAMVFGSNAAATEAAGLSVGQRFAKLFAQATVWDATANDGDGDYVTLSQALFGLSISSDANGHYYSSGMLSADKINFNASSNFTVAVGTAAQGLGFVVGKEHGGRVEMGKFSGSTLVAGLTFASDGNGGYVLDLTANRINLNAEDINWTGADAQTPRDVITDGQGNAKFSVDADGNVTMNDLTANNATLSGVLTSTGRRTSIKIDATDGNATDTAMSMCALVSLNGSTIEKQVLKVGIEDYEYDGEIHTEGVIRLGTTDDNHPGRVAIIKPQKQVIGGNSYTTVIKPGHYYMYWHGEGGVSSLIDGETVRYYAYLKLMIDEDGVHTYNIGNSPERYQWDNSSSDHGRAAFVAAVIDPA